MTSSVVQASFGINQFYRRQTAASKFSYFSGTDEQLLGVVEQNFPLRKKGKREGTWVVPIPVKISNAYCYDAVIPIHKMSFLNAETISRSKNEPPLICVSTIGPKAAAAYAEVILYERDLLKKTAEASTDKDYEIVSLNASDVKEQPDHPYEIARQVLDEGAQYDAQKICEAIRYWGIHAFVKTNFTRHVDKQVADAIKNGDSDGAIQIRRKKVPLESLSEATEYVQAVQNFLSHTGSYYR